MCLYEVKVARPIYGETVRPLEMRERRVVVVVLAIDFQVTATNAATRCWRVEGNALDVLSEVKGTSIRRNTVHTREKSKRFGRRGDRVDRGSHGNSRSSYTSSIFSRC